MRLNTGSGPTSSTTHGLDGSPDHWSSAASNAPENSTGDHTCRTQCSGSASSSAEATLPVTVLTTGIDGLGLDSASDSDSHVTTARNSSAMGIISGEWNACDTLSRLPSWPSWRITISSSASAPATTTLLGPFTEAIET